MPMLDSLKTLHLTACLLDAGTTTILGDLKPVKIPTKRFRALSLYIFISVIFSISTPSFNENILQPYSSAYSPKISQYQLSYTNKRIMTSDSDYDKRLQEDAPATFYLI